MTKEHAALVAAQLAANAETDRMLECHRADLASIQSQRSALDEAARVCQRMCNRALAQRDAGLNALAKLKAGSL